MFIVYEKASTDYDSVKYYTNSYELHIYVISRYSVSQKTFFYILDFALTLMVKKNFNLCLFVWARRSANHMLR